MVANEHIGKPRPKTVLPEDEICERIASGESLASICRNLSLGFRTIYDRLASDTEFRSKYGRAREAQAEGFVDELIDIADESTRDNAAAIRNRLETRRWVTSKILSKKYGDRPDEHHITTIVNNVMPIARQRELQERRQAALAGRVSEA